MNMKKRIFSWLMVLLLLCGCSNQQARWQEQYDLGVRYLSEGDYEEAIIAFSAAIEIDPNNPDAYVQRGDAYVMAAKAEPDRAEEYLRKAKKDYKKAENLDESLEEEMDEKLEELEELADALTAPPVPAVEMVIPEDAFIFEDHSYVVIDYPGTWEEAVEYCASQGGHLAVITSQEENDALYAYMQELGYDSAYIGLTDSAEEGTWVWVTGEESGYRNWHAGEPNGENSNEDYAMFYYKYSDGTWNDGDFGGSTVNSGTRVLCEWDGAREDASGDKNMDWQKKPQYSFNTFLEEKTYLNVWSGAYVPAEYALLDLNGDNVDELVIISATDYGFFYYQIYYWDLENGEILHAELESANPGMFYITMLYSREHSALVIRPMNNGVNFDFLEYHAFDGTGFTYIGDIGWEGGKYFSYLNGAEAELSRDGWDALNNSLLELTFTVLP